MERYKRVPEITAADFKIEDVSSVDRGFRAGLRLLRTYFPDALLANPESFAEYYDEEEELKPDQFFFQVAKDPKGNVVGVSIFNYLDRPAGSADPVGRGIIYREYIAVHPRVARSRLGSRLFWESVRRVHQEGYRPSAVVAEIVKSDPNVPGLDQNAVLGRLKFYEGLGAKVIHGINYRMPTFTHKREIPAFLMVRPLHKDFKLDLWFVRSLVYALIYDVFRYDGEISAKRAEELYGSIVTSIDRDNLKLANPLNGA